MISVRPDYEECRLPDGKAIPLPPECKATGAAHHNGPSYWDDVLHSPACIERLSALYRSSQRTHGQVCSYNPFLETGHQPDATYDGRIQRPQRRATG